MEAEPVGCPRVAARDPHLEEAGAGRRHRACRAPFEQLTRGRVGVERADGVPVRAEDAMRLVVVEGEKAGVVAQGVGSFTQRKPTWLLAVFTSPLPRVPIM